MSSGKIQGIVKELIHNHPIQPNWLASEFIRNYWEQYKAEYENNQCSSS